MNFKCEFIPNFVHFALFPEFSINLFLLSWLFIYVFLFVFLIAYHMIKIIEDNKIVIM